MPLERGQLVSIEGLDKFERPHLNGQTGTLILREPETGRWRVRLKVPPYMTVKVSASALTAMGHDSSSCDASSHLSRDVVKGPLKPRSHASIYEAQLTWSTSRGDGGSSSSVSTAENVPKQAIWPLPPAVRVRHEERAKRQPRIDKGILYKDIERHAPRAGGGANEVGRLRNHGLSIFRDKELEDPTQQFHPSLKRSPVAVAGDRRPQGLKPLSSNRLVKAVQEGDAREYNAWFLKQFSWGNLGQDHIELGDLDEECPVCQREQAAKDEQLQRKADDALVRPLTAPEGLEDDDCVDKILKDLSVLQPWEQHRAERQKQLKRRQDKQKEQFRQDQRLLEKAFSGPSHDPAAPTRSSPLKSSSLNSFESDDEEDDKTLLLAGVLPRVDPLWAPQEVEDFSLRDAEWSDRGTPRSSGASRLLEVATAMTDGAGGAAAERRVPARIRPSRLQEELEDEEARIEREFEEYELNSRPNTRGKQEALPPLCEHEEHNGNGADQGGWDFEEDEDT